jgi:hypothetical protein
MKVIPVNYANNDFEKFLDINIPSTDNRNSILYFLNPEREFFKHGEGQAFLLLDESDNPIGRIYASIDHNLNSDKKIGVFGYFLFRNNIEEAKILLKAAQNWLLQKSCQEIHGPMNLTIYHSYRLQTFGFETEAFLGEPRSLEYMSKIYQELGLVEVTDWTSWEISPLPAHLNFYRLLFRSLVNFKKKRPYKIVPFNLENYSEHFEEVYQLFMECFKDNYLFSPVTLAEFKECMWDFAKQLDSSSPLVLDQNNIAVGFAFNYPQPGTINGKKTLILHSVALKKEFRGFGVMDKMGVFLSKRILGNYGKFIGALAKKGPNVYDHISKPTRRYAMYSFPANKQL